MFGGRLLTHHIQPLTHHNSLLALFANTLYIFDSTSTHILNKIPLSDHLIITWTFLDHSSQLLALDQTGNLIQLEFQKSKLHQNSWYENFKLLPNKIITKGQIQNARISTHPAGQSDPCVYFVQDNSLFEYKNGAKNLISKQAHQILFLSDKHLVFTLSSNPNALKIIIFNDFKQNKQLLFDHCNKITSCTVYEQDLVLGDEKGKIYQIRNYLQTDRTGQQITTKYEWHVHKINGLFLDQEYLYSCGEEGTVVMWHLRQNKKDFLPRIGTQIQSVFTFEGVVYSLLKDNSIVSVDLANDKTVRSYKTVIDPLGFMTKGIKQRGANGRSLSLVSSSESNNRNLVAMSGLPGSLQILNLNEGSNHEISVLSRNLVSRIEEFYPEPHDIHDVAFNKEWTLMCCSTHGTNHNFLHFYKNEGYNLDYTLVSRVQNPHEGMIKVIAYNNLFITYAQNQTAIRFWSRVRRTKKAIIEKEEEYFLCSGQITYRQKPITNCHLLPEEHLLLVNFHDQIIFVDLKNKSIQMAFRTKAPIEQAYVFKKPKNLVNLVLVSHNKILVFDLNRQNKTISNKKIVYNFQTNEKERQIKTVTSGKGKIAFLIKYPNQELVIQYDSSKNTVLNSLLNQNSQGVCILSVCYQNQNLLAFGSDSSLINLSNDQEIVKLQNQLTVPLSGMETEQDSRQNVENESFQNLHNNYIIRQNIRRRPEINECLEKIQLEMYPSLGFSFGALCEKSFI